MEYDKINNLLLSEDNESEKLSKFVTREYVTVNSSLDTYNENKSIRLKTPMLRSNLCNYSDAYILVNGTITVAGNNLRDRQNRPLMLKNDASFISCITRINGELIEDADDLDIVVPMYNLLQYSKNYRKTIGSLYNCYRDELTDDADNNQFNNIKIVNSNTFKYKNKIIDNTNNAGTKDMELSIPLKYLGNFWRALNIPLISCQVSLELKWDKIKRAIAGANPPARYNAPTGATLAITNCKLYVPVVTLSKDDEFKLLTNLKSGFKREII